MVNIRGSCQNFPLSFRSKKNYFAVTFKQHITDITIEVLRISVHFEKKTECNFELIESYGTERKKLLIISN